MKIRKLNKKIGDNLKQLYGCRCQICGQMAGERYGSHIASDAARDYFRQGLNCTECVLRTYMDLYETGMPEEILCMATGFGGGIGHTKNQASSE